MKIYQPVAVVGFSFGGALLVMSLFPFRYAAAVIALAGILLIGFLIYTVTRGFNRYRAVLCIAFLMIFIGTVVNAAQRAHWSKLSAAFPDSPVKVVGTVEDVYGGNGRNKSYLVQTESVDIEGVPQRIRILLYGTSDAEFHTGEKIGCYITGFKNTPTRSQLGKGAQATGWIDADGQRVFKTASVVDRFMEDLVFRLKVNLKETVPAPYDTVLIAMLLGDSSEMDSSLYDSFHLTGIAHILCVSGLHIMLVGSFVSGVFRLIFGRRLFPDLMGLAAMIFFVVLTGGKLSAVRALIMASTLMLSQYIIRDYSPLNTLGGVVLFYCILDPAVVYHMGFLLSVVSVLALCVAAPCWTRAFCERFSIQNRLLEYMASILCASSAVAVFLIPIMMLFNGYTSLLSPIANLLILPITPCAMILGAVSAVAGGSVVGDLAGQMGGVLVEYMASVAKGLGKIPFAIFPLHLPYVTIWLVGTSILLLIAIITKRLQKDGKRITGMSLGLLALGMAVYFTVNHGVLQIVALESGGGGSIVVTQNRKGLVIGCGGSGVISQKVVDYMRSVGVRDFDMLVVPDSGYAQAGGVSGLVSLMEPKTVLAPEEGNALSSIYDLENSGLFPLEASKWPVLDHIELELEIEEETPPKVWIKGNGQQFFVMADGSLGLLQGDEKLLFYRREKGDTLKPKYDIITTDIIEEMKKGGFESFRRGESIVVRVAANGKMTVKGR